MQLNYIQFEIAVFATGQTLLRFLTPSFDCHTWTKTHGI